MADIKSLRPLSEDELKDKLDDNKRKLMKFQLKRKSGLDKPHEYRNLKKEIAQILTVLNDKAKTDAGKSGGPAKKKKEKKLDQEAR